MDLRAEINRMLEKHGEIIGGSPSYMKLGELIGTWEPKVDILRLEPGGDTTIDFHFRDCKFKSFLLTGNDDLYTSERNRIHLCKPHERKDFFDSLLEAYKDEYGEEWRWWCEG